jgi:hypothetical protein
MPTTDRSAAPPSARREREGRTGSGWRVIGAALLSAVTALLPGAADVAVAAPGEGPSALVRGVLDRVVVDADAPADPVVGRPRGSTPSRPIPSSWLRTSTGRIPIDADAVRDVPTGSTVAVQLTARPVAADATSPRGVTAVTVLSRASATARTAGAATVHAVTVVLALPAGSTANGMTPAALSHAVTTGVTKFWSGESDKKIIFAVSRTVGWTRLTSSCNDIWSMWDEVRDRIGFTPGPRRHLLVYAPSGSGCPTGLATVGGAVDAGGNVIVGGSTTSLLAHELGHNLGLGHSEELTCPGEMDSVHTTDGFGSGCRVLPYGDWYDVMGISWENLGSLSTAHAYRLGLLPASAVVSTHGPARVTLRPVSTRVGVRSLRIQDSSGATYVVEYRPARGADAWIGTAADWHGLRPGVLIRRTDPDDSAATLLLDPTPSAHATADQDVDVAAPTGRTITTASGRISIMVESATPDAVTVAVSLDGMAPALVVQPGGRLINGRQVTIGQALAAWGSLAS